MDYVKMTIDQSGKYEVPDLKKKKLKIYLRKGKKEFQYQKSIRCKAVTNRKLILK